MAAPPLANTSSQSSPLSAALRPIQTTAVVDESNASVNVRDANPPPQLDGARSSLSAGNSRPPRVTHRKAIRPQLYDVTSPTFIWNVLGLGVYVATPTRTRKSSSRRSIVVTEIDLRALLMKVLQWFVERRGMSAIGSHVAFVGNLDSELDKYTVVCPLGMVGELATELVPQLLDQASSKEFEACMLRVEEEHALDTDFVATLLSVLWLSVTMTFIYLISMFFHDVSAQFIYM